MASQSEMGKTFMVLASALVAAVLVTGFFISNYGPTGRYELKNVLLNADVLKQLNYNDWDQKIAESDRFVFDRIVFAAKSEQTVDLETYAKIYEILSHDKSELKSDQPFAEGGERLIIYARTESSLKWQNATKIIQQVQFLPSGNEYRVELHEDSKGTHWIYFYHKNIREQINAMFAS